MKKTKEYYLVLEPKAIITNVYTAASDGCGTGFALLTQAEKHAKRLPSNAAGKYLIAKVVGEVIPQRGAEVVRYKAPDEHYHVLSGDEWVKQRECGYATHSFEEATAKVKYLCGVRAQESSVWDGNETWHIVSCTLDHTAANWPAFVPNGLIVRSVVVVLEL